MLHCTFHRNRLLKLWAIGVLGPPLLDFCLGQHPLAYPVLCNRRADRATLHLQRSSQHCNLQKSDLYAVCKTIRNPSRRRMLVNDFYPTIAIRLHIFLQSHVHLKTLFPFLFWTGIAWLFKTNNGKNKCMVKTWRELCLRALICCEDERVREETFGVWWDPDVPFWMCPVKLLCQVFV